MRCVIIRGGMILAASLWLAACGGGSAPPASNGAGGPTQPVGSPTVPPETQIQEDVPILDGALDLRVTSNGTFIRYEAPSTIEDAIKFYQDQLAVQGWEQQNKGDSGFGDSITLLRSKGNQNISVTLQSIAGSDNVRVQIALSPK